MAAHCQRSQARRQICREENSLQHFTKTPLYNSSVICIYKCNSDNTAAKDEKKNKLLYLNYKRKIVLPLMAGGGWGGGVVVTVASFALRQVHVY